MDCRSCEINTEVKRQLLKVGDLVLITSRHIHKGETGKIIKMVGPFPLIELDSGTGSCFVLKPNGVSVVNKETSSDALEQPS